MHVAEPPETLTETVGAALVPDAATFLLVDTQPSLTDTVAEVLPMLEIEQDEAAAEPLAHPLQLVVRLSFSASLEVEVTLTLQGELGRGWHDPPPPVVTEGAVFVPLALPEAWAEPPRPSLTVTVQLVPPGELIVHVAAWPLPLAHPLQL